jgi:hypothetical protein
MKTKMKSYFFPANAPKVILCIILFGINSEIRIKAKKINTQMNIYKGIPIAIR